MPTPGPDEPLVFDDDFVRAAPVQEAAGDTRVQRARVIAAAHDRRTPWRAPGGGVNLLPPGRAPGRVRRHRRDLGKGLLAVVVTVGALGLAQLSGATGRTPEALTGWATGAPSVPVPPDAAAVPLGVPVPAPPGEGGYAFLHQHAGRPVAFDPCRPLHYVVRPDGAPPAASRLVAQAAAQLSAATGLVLVDDGSTTEAPSERRAPHQPDRYGDRWAPVLIAWSTAEQDPGLAGSVAGYAGPHALDPDGRGPRLVTGQVVLDAAAADPSSQLMILLHELGHLAGLDHVPDPADTMHARSALMSSYTPGALRGLHQLGQGRCFG